MIQKWKPPWNCHKKVEHLSKFRKRFNNFVSELNITVWRVTIILVPSQYFEVQNCFESLISSVMSGFLRLSSVFLNDIYIFENVYLFLEAAWNSLDLIQL